MDTVFTLFAKGQRFLASLAGRMQSPFLLAIRLYWGWQFAQSGWGKLHRLDQVTEFFASLNIPMPHANAVMVSNLEFFGGVLLILGLASRLTGLVLTGNMLVAYVTADREALTSVFTDPGKFYAADPYTFLFASLMVLIFGAGFFSLDALFGSRASTVRKRERAPWPTATGTQPVTQQLSR
ncbi:MAG TPA: DoxX family protein [Terracidiphilus sp.]|jgi:putative oxidoreductase|nr:DoxX family protein [Terracidiphilus sp.]